MMLEGRYRHVEDMQVKEEEYMQYIMYQDKRYNKPCLSHSRPTTCPTIPPSPTCKSVRLPGRSRKGSVIRVPTSQTMNGHPVVEVSNIYTMLDYRLDIIKGVSTIQFVFQCARVISL